MTVGYCLPAEVQNRAGIASTTNVDAAIIAASRAIDTFCGRTFTVASSTATARVYRAVHPDMIDVDDIATSSGVIVKTDDDNDGVFETTWAATDYALLPLNQVRGSIVGHPYDQIERLATRCWPVARRACVEVTAKWGWSAVPATVAAVCIDVAARGAQGATGIRTEVLGGYQVTYHRASSGGDSAIWLAAAEVDALTPFRKIGIA